MSLIMKCAEKFGHLAPTMLDPKSVVNPYDLDTMLTSWQHLDYFEESKAILLDLIDAGIPVIVWKRKLTADGRGVTVPVQLEGLDDLGSVVERERGWANIDPHDEEQMARLRARVEQGTMFDAYLVAAGHGLDVIDLDRHGDGGDGFLSWETWSQANEMPLVVGQAETPRNGRHLYINTTGAPLARVGVLPGVDYTRLAYVAPTLKPLPDGSLGVYEWTIPPMLDELNEDDQTGTAWRLEVEGHARAGKGRELGSFNGNGTVVPFEGGPAYGELSSSQRAAVDGWVRAAAEGLARDLRPILELPEGATAPFGDGGDLVGWERAAGTQVVPTVLRWGLTKWHPWSVEQGIEFLLGLSSDPAWHRLVEEKAETKVEFARERGAIPLPIGARSIRSLSLSGRPAARAPMDSRRSSAGRPPSGGRPPMGGRPRGVRR